MSDPTLNWNPLSQGGLLSVIAYETPSFSGTTGLQGVDKTATSYTSTTEWPAGTKLHIEIKAQYSPDGGGHVQSFTIASGDFVIGAPNGPSDVRAFVGCANSSTTLHISMQDYEDLGPSIQAAVDGEWDLPWNASDAQWEMSQDTTVDGQDFTFGFTATCEGGVYVCTMSCTGHENATTENLTFGQQGVHITLTGSK